MTNDEKAEIRIFTGECDEAPSYTTLLRAMKVHTENSLSWGSESDVEDRKEIITLACHYDRDREEKISLSIATPRKDWDGEVKRAEVFFDKDTLVDHFRELFCEEVHRFIHRHFI